MLDVVVVLVASLDALLSAEVLIRAGALLCVAHLVVERRAGTITAAVGRSEREDNHPPSIFSTMEISFQRGSARDRARLTLTNISSPARTLKFFDDVFTVTGSLKVLSCSTQFQINFCAF